MYEQQVWVIEDGEITCFSLYGLYFGFKWFKTLEKNSSFHSQCNVDSSDSLTYALLSLTF